MSVPPVPPAAAPDPAEVGRNVALAVARLRRQLAAIRSFELAIPRRVHPSSAHWSGGRRAQAW